MNGLRVLIIEDESSVFIFLKKYFEDLHYEVKVSVNGNDGIIDFKNSRFDIVILDLGLPDKNGLLVLRELREWNNTPIIILTANDSDEDKISALELGADDYLTKPFNVLELNARIKAISRRTNQTNLENKIETNSLSIELSSHLAKFKKVELHLTQIEFEILKHLMINNGKVVVHRILLKNIWGPNSVEHTQYLRVYVGQLRKKLIDAGAIREIIKTETGVGYRLLD